jgi:hypothetical protein
MTAFFMTALFKGLHGFFRSFRIVFARKNGETLTKNFTAFKRTYFATSALNLSGNRIACGGRTKKTETRRSDERRPTTV